MSFVKKAWFKNRGRVVSGLAGIFTAAMLVFTFVSCEQPEDPVPAPVINITINPAETMVTVGSISGSLTVAANVSDGTTPVFQWYSTIDYGTRDGSIINGQTSAVFTIPEDLTEGTYYYFCEASAPGAASVRSGIAAVVVYAQDKYLEFDTWADGMLPQDGEQWFSFTATADTQWLHISFGTLPGAAVVLYNSNRGIIEGFDLSKSSTGATSFLRMHVTSGQVYYLQVADQYLPSYSGTYKICINTSPFSPGVTPTELTFDTWADGMLPQDGEQWFSFTATADTQWIHGTFGTLPNLRVSLYDSNWSSIEGRPLYSSEWGTRDFSRSLTNGQVYYIKVTPYSPSENGTYKIGFNTSRVPPGVTPTELTFDTWADGILQQGREQWFSFTATATGSNFVHLGLGTLLDMAITVYDDSNGDYVISWSSFDESSNIYSFVDNAMFPMTSGQIYYIRVAPSDYFDYDSGTYKIGLNTSRVPPWVTPTELTFDTWADGNLPTANAEQWYSFTATANEQYIQAAFGTLEYMQALLFDSSGKMVGGWDTVNGSTGTTGRIHESVTSGQVYYVKVTPYSSTFSGTYKICFNSSITPPGVTPTELTFDTWADGMLPQGGEQWFSFTATADTKHIHTNFGTSTDMSVMLYDKTARFLGGISTSRSSDITIPIPQSVTNGDMYYIRVAGFSDSSGGAYKIGVTSSIVPPGVTSTELTFDTWADGNLPTADAEQWYSFTAIADTQYIHKRKRAADTFVTKMQLYDSNGKEVRFNNNTRELIPLSVTSGQVYYIKVMPYDSTFSGTYKICFNTSITPPGVTPTELTFDTWADGNLPTADAEQWYSFTATADKQYIHAGSGTLNYVDTRTYDIDGELVYDRSLFYDFLAIPVTSGETYYIKVTPSSGSGTYKICFNSSATPPGVTSTELTFDTWADGNLPTADAEQWFNFTATADTQYIHASFGTLDSLAYINVLLYNSNGQISSFGLYVSSTVSDFTFQSFTSGETYYIKVTPSSGSGTYKIGFTASTTPPAN